MTFWDWLERRWPTERGWVTILTFTLAASLLKMAEVHEHLWNVELFKTLLTLVIGTAIVNMILAFHFTANKGDEQRSQNTGKLADAFRAVADNAGGTTTDTSTGQPAGDPPPTGRPGDPVHVVEEEAPEGRVE
jgi:hypothetical protein